MLNFNSTTSNGIGMFLCARQPRSIRSIRSIAIEHLFEFPASLVATSSRSLAPDVACRHWKHLQLSSIDWFQMISGTFYREPLNECTNLGGFPHMFPAILRFPSYQILLSDSDTSKIYYHVGMHNDLNGSSWEPVSTNIFTGGYCHCHVSRSLLLFYPFSLAKFYPPTLKHLAKLPSWPHASYYSVSPRLSDGIHHPPGIIHTAQFLDQKKPQQKSKHLSRNGHAQIGDVGRSVPHHYWHRWGD